ncbi:hypothetical protein L6452_36817 [Arctium lappa]|uniref:Uncharacterized protein n=1 Tax=Arctium lappa TaxID=4217 RepID=A0ACB8Y1Y3_ARCLA|nr:hypothetical protein L6452_36817 [Arctium lappa]
MWVLLLMFSFTTSDTNSNTSETYTLIKASNLAKPSCPSRCRDIIVPYPFGIGVDSKCSLDPGFDVYCNSSTHPPKATFSEAYYAFIKQISDSTLRISNMVSTKWRNSKRR